MPDWFQEFQKEFHTDPELPFDLLVFRIGTSCIFGLLVAGIYWATHRRDDTLAPSFISTLVLLAILMAMVTQVIGKNAALAFSLVGALSVVRFRTVVEDTRDTAFVIFAVVVGMAVGAGHLVVALVGLCVVGIAATITRPRRSDAVGATPFWSLRVRIGSGQNAEVLERVFREHVDQSQLLGTETGRQGAAIDLTYKVRLKPASSPTAIVAELNRVEGVQNVELRRI